jgi:sRNA-binding carbon storage regulator CsrA
VIEADVSSDQQRVGRICMDLHPGERLLIGDTGVEVEVVHKSGKAARLRVVAPRDMRISRESGAQQLQHGIPSMAG